jgi:mannose-6-phosphate isomerase-like protein (cupin superfamily)
MKISETIVRRVAKRFPQAKIVRIPERNSQEIIFEVMRDPNGSFGVAVAIIAQSKPHFHEHTYESYLVLEGQLDLYEEGSHEKAPLRLGPNEGFLEKGFRVIYPGRTRANWAKAHGKPAVVLVTSSPAWTPEDHHLRPDIKV